MEDPKRIVTSTYIRKVGDISRYLLLPKPVTDAFDLPVGEYHIEVLAAPNGCNIVIRHRKRHKVKLIPY